MTIFTESDARQCLQIFLDVLERRGCPCVQKGRSSKPCRDVFRSARQAIDATVLGLPQLQEELRRAASRVNELPEAECPVSIRRQAADIEAMAAGFPARYSGEFLAVAALLRQRASELEAT